MTGNPGLDKVLMMINAAAITGAAALVFYSHNMIKRPGTDEGAQMEGLVKSAIETAELTPVVFPKVTVNLYSRKTRLRFLDVQLNLEVFDLEDQGVLKAQKPFIFDALIDITGNMKPAELNSITGRILLETRLKNKINHRFNRKVVRKIYFSKYIIQ